MLTTVLIVSAGVEDDAFNASIADHASGDLGTVERSNGVYIVTPIVRHAPTVQSLVDARIRREGLSFQASAIVATSPRAIVVMTNQLAASFSVVAGRLPRPCTPALCEYAEDAPGPAQVGVIPAGGRPDLSAFSGYRFVNVGRVHERARAGS